MRPMEYIECPQTLHPSRKTTIFLAGGITGCPDWQKDVVARFVETGHPVRIANPRRKQFDVKDDTLAEEQIIWEYDAMSASDVILFWFPKESLCPIALYELGRYNALRTKTLFIGTHVDYPRRKDVVIQTKLATGASVFSSMDELVDRAIDHIDHLIAPL